MQPRRKQQATHEEWVRALATVKQRVSYDEAVFLVERAAMRIRQRFAPYGLAYAWSGGKESQALRVVCDAAGIDECLLGICDLEYPAFLAWATDHMPPSLEVVNTGQDLNWLAAHPTMLFPATANIAAKWFAAVQHTAQRRYFKGRKVQTLLLGRRRGDGNYVGRDGDWTYEKDGVLRASPIHDWTNDELLAVLAWYDVPLPPCYGWPRGFRVGTGPWPARQWTGGIMQGWAEVFEIDPSIVRAASRRVPSAAEYLERVVM